MPRGTSKRVKTGQNALQPRGRRSDPIAKQLVNKSSGQTQSPLNAKKRKSEPLTKPNPMKSPKINTNASASGVFEAKRLCSVAVTDHFETRSKALKTIVTPKKGGTPKSVTSAQFQEEDDVVEIELKGGQLSEFDGDCDSDAGESGQNPDPMSDQESYDVDSQLNETNAMDPDDEEGEIASDNDSNSTTDSVKIKKVSVEDKLDQLTSAFVSLQQIMLKKGFLSEEDDPNHTDQGSPEAREQQRSADRPEEAGRESMQKQGKTLANTDKVGHQPEKLDSVTTIYKNAVRYLQVENIECQPESMQQKRFSSSDEDMIDTSDEFLELPYVKDSTLPVVNGLVAGPSRGGNDDNSAVGCDQNPGLARAEKIVKEAEASRAKILMSQGKDQANLAQQQSIVDEAGVLRSTPVIPIKDYLLTALMDEDYLVVGGHVDEATRIKILEGDYVDFARLLPRDRLSVEEDHRMEIINRGGMTYWVPVSDRETAGTISGFAKWEQVFRVYANIYTTKFPSKASELIQYSHIIHTATSTYIWDNVYQYDREFRLHMSRHPQRSWAIILQQAWNLRLREKLSHNTFSAGKNGRAKSKEPCKWFNKGLCTNGLSCKYEHHCMVPKCDKFGHGAHICRKRVGATTSFMSPEVQNDPARGNSNSNSNNRRNSQSK